MNESNARLLEAGYWPLVGWAACVVVVTAVFAAALMGSLWCLMERLPVWGAVVITALWIGALLVLGLPALVLAFPNAGFPE